MGNEQSQQIQYGDKLENNVEVKWEQLSEANEFAGRDGHCASAIGKKLFIFGGVTHSQSQDDNINESNDILVFDSESKEWNHVQAKGMLPPARSSATMAAVNNKLYLFGGLSRETGWFDAVHVFDSETNTWSELETEGTAPSPRDKLASAVIGENIYIFGGFGPQGMEEEEVEEFSDEDEVGEVEAQQDGAQFGWFNDLFVFNTATKTWSSPMQMNLGCPTARAACGMCAIKQYLVIFGGRDAEGRRNDLHIFDTVSRKWQTELIVQGRQPEPRSFHTVTAVDDRVVVMGGRGISDQHFGDFHIFDTANRHWLQPKLQGTLPSARGVHTATVVGDYLLVYGGSGNFSKEIMQCTSYFKDLSAVKTADILTGSGWLPKDISPEKSSDTPESSQSNKRPLSDSDNHSTSENGKTDQTKKHKPDIDILSGKALQSQEVSENQENMPSNANVPSTAGEKLTTSSASPNVMETH